MGGTDDQLELFAVCAPGLEPIVADEIGEMGAGPTARVPGGVTFHGDARTLMRANLQLRCATRVLLRLPGFPVFHLAQLDKRARRVDWRKYLPADRPVKVQATCKRSNIYHSGAAVERVQRAITEEAGIAPARRRAPEATVLQVRIKNNFCTLSLDSSGEPLYKRGLKPESAAAPLRETLAAGALRLSGYRGDEAFLDPMCGTGTIMIEAAMIALDRLPGAARRFAFMDWPGFDPQAWEGILADSRRAQREAPRAPLFASDHKGGAVATTNRNLDSAGLSGHVTVARASLSDLEPPAESGLLLCNPPYGRRLGADEGLLSLYQEFGRIARERFVGWRVGFVTNRRELASATGLDVRTAGSPLSHGGMRIRLYLSGPGGDPSG